MKTFFYLIAFFFLVGCSSTSEIPPCCAKAGCSEECIAECKKNECTEEDCCANCATEGCQGHACKKKSETAS